MGSAALQTQTRTGTIGVRSHLNRGFDPYTVVIFLGCSALGCCSWGTASIQMSTQGREDDNARPARAGSGSARMSRVSDEMISAYGRGIEAGSRATEIPNFRLC